MAPRRQRGDVDTPSRILDIAERLAQVRGFNGFSYADVASELKITKASLHYHFSGKAELGDALIARYAARFADALEAIDERGGDAPAKLEAYAAIYADVLRDRRMCLCGMLAAEYDTLPEPMRAAIIGFFDANEAWLTRVLEQGQEEGSLRLTGSATDEADDRQRPRRSGPHRPTVRGRRALRGRGDAPADQPRPCDAERHDRDHRVSATTPRGAAWRSRSSWRRDRPPLDHGWRLALTAMTSQAHRAAAR